MARRTLALACLFLVAASLGAQAPANDECVNAVQLFDGVNPGPPTGLSGFTFTNVGATESAGAASCLTANPGTSDVWFIYVATFTGPCIISTCIPAGFTAGTLGDTEVEIYDQCAGVRLACDDDACTFGTLNSSVVASLTSGIPYIVRICAWSTTNTVEGTFYVSVAPMISPPGDDCVTATALLAPDGVFHGSTAGMTVPLTPPAGSCGAVTATMVDVWWVYVPPASGILSVSRDASDPTATNGSDVAGATALEMYDATQGCTTLPASLICNATTVVVMSATVIGGTPYYIRMGVAPGTAQGSYSLSINLLSAPTNDECVAPGPLFDGLNPATGIYTNTAATNSAGAAAACAGGAPGNSDVWFVYQANVTGNVVATTCTPPGVPSPGSLADTILEAYAGCGGAAIGCNDDDPACGTRSTMVFPVAAGLQYIVRVSSKATATGTFYITINPFPTNDDCATALAVAPGGNGPFFHLGATNGATPAPSCAASNGDLWFAFTSPLTATLQADTCGSTFDTSLALYASCGGAEIVCDNDDVLNRGPCATTQTNASYLEAPVVAGTTYFFRIGGLGTTTFGSSVLNLAYKFSLIVGSNQTAGTVHLTDVAGTPGAMVLNVVTMSQGAFPSGWLYGVDIPYGELVAEILTGPPFLVTLSGSGGYSFTAGGASFLAGITFYCVGIELTSALTPFRRTDLVAATL
jgi:hypothetical protein